MKTYTPDELKAILEQHRLWLDNSNEGTRADLSGANLTRADLTRADLTRAYLTRAYLSGADLSGAYLSGADLSGADLSGADLSGAGLSGAGLRRANLSGADLTDAKSDNTTQWPHYQICPPEGTFIAYKSVRCGIILTLEIPADAARTSSLIGRKCRASKVNVLRAQNADGSDVADGTELISHHNSTFVYKIGETAEVADFDNDPKVECTRGIHFFVTRKEAEEYQ